MHIRVDMYLIYTLKVLLLLYEKAFESIVILMISSYIYILSSLYILIYNYLGIIHPMKFVCRRQLYDTLQYTSLYFGNYVMNALFNFWLQRGMCLSPIEVHHVTASKS